MKNIKMLLTVALVVATSIVASAQLTFPELLLLKQELYKNPSTDLLNKYNEEVIKLASFSINTLQNNEILPPSERVYMPERWRIKIIEEYSRTGKWTNPYTGEEHTGHPNTFLLWEVALRAATMLIFAQETRSIEELKYEASPKRLKEGMCTKYAQKSFSVFFQDYAANELKKGEFEKNADWEVRKAAMAQKDKMEELKREAIKAYANYLNVKTYKGDLKEYDAEKEIFTLECGDFGYIPVHVPIGEAQAFKNDDFDYTDVEYFIENDQIGLAEITFATKSYSNANKQYKYSNPSPVAQNWLKPKREREAKEQLANEYIAQAKQAFNSNNTKLVAEYGLKAYELNPQLFNHLELSNLGIRLAQQGSCDKAIKILAEVVDAIRPSSSRTDALFALASCYYETQNYDKAIQISSREAGRGHHYDKSKYYNIISLSYERTGNIDKAIEYCEEAIRTSGHKNELEYYNRLATLYLSKKDFPAAKEVYSIIVKKHESLLRDKLVHTTFARTYYLLGNAYLGLNKKSKAKKCYKLAVKSGDKDAQAALEKM